MPGGARRALGLVSAALLFCGCGPAPGQPDGAAPPDDRPETDAGLDDTGVGPDDGGPGPGPVDGGDARADGGSPPGDAGSPADAGAPPQTCPWGFVFDGASCRPEGPVALTGRGEGEVCGHWSAEHVTVSPEWVASDPDDPCDQGVVPDDAQQNGVRRTNLYRWLVGLPGVTLDEGLLGGQQACAITLYGRGSLSHSPPEGTECWLAEGAAAAGQSNLAQGAGLAQSVDLYVGDNGVGSLGHRRWVLNRGMSVTAFGFRPSMGCMYAFSSGGSADVEYTAWPPPGFVPTAAAPGEWSLTVYGGSVPDTVEVAVDEGPFEAVAVEDLPFGYGQGSTIAFSPPGGNQAVWEAGGRARVRATGGDGPIEYTVAFTGCE